jgi:tetratricopeptide (TPR) repeat protein
MIAKNEAENLPRALTSVAAVADEVIVVDTGSTDDTVVVAKRLGAKVGHFAWRNDFAAARNASIEMASAAWILILDADEELAPESVQPLRTLVAEEPTEPVIFAGTTESILDSGLMGSSQVARVLPNLPSLRYRRPIHEELTNVDGGAAPMIGAPGLRILHHGYLGSERTRKAKVERNLSMLLAKVEQDPDDVVSWYYLGIEYGAARMPAAAAGVFSRWLDAIEQHLQRRCAIPARQYYAGALHELGRRDEAGSVAAEGARKHDSTTLSAIAALYLTASRPNEARAFAQRVLTTAETTSDEPLRLSAARALALTALGDVKLRAGDLEGGRAEYLAAITMDGGASEPRLRLAAVLEAMSQLDDARTTLLAALDRAPADAPTHIALARLERRMGLLQEAYDRLSEQVARTPRNLYLRLELATVLYDAKEFALGADVLAAAEELPELAASAPRFRAQYFGRLAYGCTEAQRFDDAIRAFRNAAQADPSSFAPTDRPAAADPRAATAPVAAAADPVAPVGRA